MNLPKDTELTRITHDTLRYYQDFTVFKEYNELAFDLVFFFSLKYMTPELDNFCSFDTKEFSKAMGYSKRFLNERIISEDALVYEWNGKVHKLERRIEVLLNRMSKYTVRMSTSVTEADGKVVVRPDYQTILSAIEIVLEQPTSKNTCFNNSRRRYKYILNDKFINSLGAAYRNILSLDLYVLRKSNKKKSYYPLYFELINMRYLQETKGVKPTPYFNLLLQACDINPEAKASDQKRRIQNALDRQLELTSLDFTYRWIPDTPNSKYNYQLELDFIIPKVSKHEMFSKHSSLNDIVVERNYKLFIRDLYYNTYLDGFDNKRLAMSKAQFYSDRTLFKKEKAQAFIKEYEKIYSKRLKPDDPIVIYRCGIPD